MIPLTSYSLRGIYYIVLFIFFIYIFLHDKRIYGLPFSIFYIFEFINLYFTTIPTLISIIMDILYLPLFIGGCILLYKEYKSLKK